MRTIVRFALVSVLCVGIVSCDDEPRACTDSGMGALLIPDERAAAITEVRPSGECSVFAPTKGCNTTPCATADGGLQRIFLVQGRDWGECVVTVAFSDGGSPIEQRYTFSGGTDTCCNDICVEGGGVAFAGGNP